jgi:hypothetical protein
LAKKDGILICRNPHLPGVDQAWFIDSAYSSCLMSDCQGRFFKTTAHQSLFLFAVA